jgi:hypothetical protein
MAKLLFFILAISFLVSSSAQAQWGIDMGGSREVQYGTFLAPCGCTFQPSAGFGLLGHISYEAPLASSVYIAGTAGVHYMKYTAYEEPDTKEASDLATIGMTYVTLEPSLRYKLFETPAFLRLGANVGFLVNNTYHHETHPIPDPKEDIDSSMGDLRTIRLAAALSAGYTIPVGTMSILPTLTVEYPINVIRDENASDWKVMSYYATIGLRFGL